MTGSHATVQISVIFCLLFSFWEHTELFEFRFPLLSRNPAAFPLMYHNPPLPILESRIPRQLMCFKKLHAVSTSATALAFLGKKKACLSNNHGTFCQSSVFAADYRQAFDLRRTSEIPAGASWIHSEAIDFRARSCVLLPQLSLSWKRDCSWSLLSYNKST